MNVESCCPFFCVVKKHLREFAVFLRCGKIETKAVGPQKLQTPSSTRQQNENFAKFGFVGNFQMFFYLLAGRIILVFCIFSRVRFFRISCIVFAGRIFSFFVILGIFHCCFFILYFLKKVVLLYFFEIHPQKTHRQFFGQPTKRGQATRQPREAAPGCSKASFQSHPYQCVSSGNLRE